MSGDPLSAPLGILVLLGVLSAIHVSYNEQASRNAPGAVAVVDKDR